MCRSSIFLPLLLLNFLRPRQVIVHQVSLILPPLEAPPFSPRSAAQSCPRHGLIRLKLATCQVIIAGAKRKENNLSKFYNQTRSSEKRNSDLFNPKLCIFSWHFCTRLHLVGQNIDNFWNVFSIFTFQSWDQHFLTVNQWSEPQFCDKIIFLKVSQKMHQCG